MKKSFLLLLLTGCAPMHIEPEGWQEVPTMDEGFRFTKDYDGVAILLSELWPGRDGVQVLIDVKNTSLWEAKAFPQSIELTTRVQRYANLVAAGALTVRPQETIKFLARFDCERSEVERAPSRLRFEIEHRGVRKPVDIEYRPK